MSYEQKDLPGLDSLNDTSTPGKSESDLSEDNAPKKSESGNIILDIEAAQSNREKALREAAQKRRAQGVPPFKRQKVTQKRASRPWTERTDLW
jgi:hypothetical protein